MKTNRLIRNYISCLGVCMMIVFAANGQGHQTWGENKYTFNHDDLPNALELWVDNTGATLENMVVWRRSNEAASAGNIDKWRLEFDLGVGCTPANGYRLHVDGKGLFREYQQEAEILLIPSSTGNVDIKMETHNLQKAMIGIQDNDANGTYTYFANTTSENYYDGININVNNYVGIGTRYPTEQLEVEGNAVINGNIEAINGNIEAINGNITIVDVTASGDITASTITTTGAITTTADGDITSDRYLGGAAVRFKRGGDDDYEIGTQEATQYFRSVDAFAWYKGGGHSNTQFESSDNPNDGSSVLMLLKSDNSGGLMQVKKIETSNVEVNPSLTFPDYVFDNNYQLRSLENVAAFIDKNKHLPEVPSAEDIKNNGYDVGEMDAILLKKIEEITLYMLEIKAENQVLKAKISALQK